jgi:hypothetical protein
VKNYFMKANINLQARFLFITAMLTFSSILFSCQNVAAQSAGDTTALLSESAPGTQVKDAVVAPENILRIEGTASISWKGVSGCCEQKTADKQSKKAIESWVGQQILANRPHRYYRSGPIGKIVQAKCSSETDWRGVRKCKGSWKQPYYIEFIRQ